MQVTMNRAAVCLHTRQQNLNLEKKAKQRHRRDRGREKMEHQAYHHMGCVALLPYIMMCLAPRI